jgi:hypothetical protein
VATTTVHIPDQLLARIDREARAQGLSRNRFVIAACVDALGRHAGQWPEGFFDTGLSPEDEHLLRAATAEIERAITSQRRNRGAVAL